MTAQAVWDMPDEEWRAFVNRCMAASPDPAFAVEWWEKEHPEDRECAKIMRPDGGGQLFELVEPT